MREFLQSASNGQPRRLLGSISTGILSALMKSLPYFFMLGAVNELLGPLIEGRELNYGVLNGYCIAIAIAYLLQFLSGMLSLRVSQHTACDIIADGRVKTADHLKKLPMSYFAEHDPGRVSSMMLTSFDHLQALICDAIDPICKAVVMPILGFVSMLFFNLPLALIMISVVPVSLLISILGAKLVRRVGGKLLESRTEADSRIIEYASSISLIKTFGLEGKKFKRLESAFKSLKDESVRLEATTGPVSSIASVVLFVGVALVGIVGFNQFMAGEITFLVYAMFLIVAPKLYDSLVVAIEFFLIMNFYYESVQRIQETNRKPEMPEPQQAADLHSLAMDCRDVRFRYLEADVLNDVSMHIPEKTVTALVGPSGSGKTTMVKLLARFWDVNEGEITLGGASIRNMPYSQLIEHISMVFQDVYLFEDTILNNIRIAKPEASMDEVITAAKMASCHTFISQLPKGYDTLVGEGGSTLSGGERQRISIARAILKDTPIVLLDEATASLDPENEVHVQRAISELVQSKTVVVIAHHLKTVVEADQILVFNEGGIVERGTHDTLLALDGLYSNMWKEQQRAKGWRLVQPNA